MTLKRKTAQILDVQDMNIKKGEITLEHVAIFVILIALLVVILIFTGVLRVQVNTIVKKFMDFIIGR